MAKLKFVIPVVLIALAGVYKFVLAKPAVEPKRKVEGQVYVLPKEFLVNLKGGQFAKANVALVLPEHAEVAAAGGEEAASAPPEGFGTLPQEALVRAIVTDTLTGRSPRMLTSGEGREVLKRRLKRELLKGTDVEVEDVLFTDIAVQ